MDHIKCADCRYWGLNAEDWDVPPGFRTCGLAPMSSTITGWDEETHENSILSEYADVKFSVMDASSYRAALHTRGDFYCACAEGKKTPATE